MNTKIKPLHLEKKAYVYLRQSSFYQVKNNKESTLRQYDLKNKALECGWNENQIIVLDDDLGCSASCRDDLRVAFKKMISEVALENVGAIFALEATRLCRS